MIKPFFHTQIGHYWDSNIEFLLKYKNICFSPINNPDNPIGFCQKLKLITIVSRIIVLSEWTPVHSI
jgi:hypothetical protein